MILKMIIMIWNFMKLRIIITKKNTDKLTLSTDIINLINYKKIEIDYNFSWWCITNGFYVLVIEYINKFNLDSKQVILVTANLRGNETYKLLLEEFPSFKKYPMKHVGINSFYFEDF